MDGLETREILIPHDLTRGPLTAVRRMLIHSSLAELKQAGYFERYCQQIDPTSLASITDLIGPGWLSVELALEHYRACDQMRLSHEETIAAGVRAGEKMQGALLGAAARGPDLERSAWTVIGGISRLGRRLYEGGSSQYVRLGPKNVQIEHALNPLFSVRYYYVAHLGFLRGAFQRLGFVVDEAKISPYRSAGAQCEFLMSWK